MTLSTIAINDCFAEAEAGSSVVPDFHFLDIADDSPFRLMRLQPRGTLTASPDEGVRHASALHLDKCREALRTARNEYADLFVTPEYCIPVALIGEILRDPKLQPRPNTLWCLGCEGISLDPFYDHMMQWEDAAIVSRKPLEDMRENRFVNFLLYVFPAKDGRKLCLVPQLKLQRMNDPQFHCEGAGLSLGKKVVVFGEDSANQLFSIVCADAFHPEIHSGSLFFPDRTQRRYIILHPQLNPAPRHSSIAALRNNMFKLKSARDSLYITSNWADGTTVAAGGSPALRIGAPWSSIYRRFISLDGERSWNERLREIRNRNFRHGLGFGFLPSNKIKVWYAVKSEHLQLIQLTKPYDGGAELPHPPANVRAEKAFVPGESARWQPAELPFESALPDILVREAVEEYGYPHTAPAEQLDKFFGYCTGHLEEGQLLLSEEEQSSRISCHIDEQCEPGRVRGARQVARLILRLKNKETLPGQLRRFEGKYRLQPGMYVPFNLLPKSGNETQGALVAYTDDADSMKSIVDRIYNALPSLVPFIKDNICIFSHNEYDESVHYPVFSNLYTSSERTSHSTDFTEGGPLIDAELD